MTRLPFILLSTTDGSPITGAAPTVTISKDGAAFASATNTPAEIGNGYYYIDLTAAETTVTNNVIIRATATGAQPTAVVWEPEQDLSGLSTFDPSTDAVTIDATQADTFATASSVANIATVANTIKSKTDNLPANPAAVTDVTTAQAAIIGAMPDVSGLATATALTTVGNNVAAVKAKTDNLPVSPAAIGDAMTLTSAYDAAKTASQFDPANTAVTIDSASVAAVQSGLSTFDAANDPVTITTAQAATLATAAAQATQTAALDKLAASILHWTATASTLTLYDSNGAAIGVYDLTRDSSGNITAIEPHVEG